MYKYMYTFKYPFMFMFLRVRQAKRSARLTVVRQSKFKSRPGTSKNEDPCGYRWTPYMQDLAQIRG
jgi:hypothetical protein